MGHRDGVRLQLVVPIAHPQLDRGIALAARRRHRPFVGWRLAKSSGSAASHLAPASSLPNGRSRFRAGDRRARSRPAAGPARRAPDPWSARAAERACDEGETPPVAAVARKRSASTSPACAACLRPRSLSGMSCCPAAGPAHSSRSRRGGCSRWSGAGMADLQAIPCRCSARYPARPAASCRRRDSRNRRGAPRR